MVTIHKKQTMVSDKGEVRPVMPIHRLIVKKEAPSFPVGIILDCFIAEYENKRFCVWGSSFVADTVNYHVFDSKDQLNEHFDEVTMSQVANI